MQKMLQQNGVKAMTTLEQILKKKGFTPKYYKEKVVNLFQIENCVKEWLQQNPEKTGKELLEEL